jgi:A/G-specific adenine glycosylase
MSRNKLSFIRRGLLRWYDRTHRDLPWRRTRDPYAIWIAETMLQQTQVTAVVPYYERFLKAFPTVEDLDRAPLRRVLAIWSGLGYYRRAEGLKKSARKLVRAHKGKLPQTYDALRELPGVGDYTAGALLSIAFGKPYPAIDGNARRVLGRIFALDTEAKIRGVATRLVPTLRPGYFNQALMELGARICLAQKPRCPECPVASHCKSRANRRRFAAKKPQIFRNVTWPLGIVRSSGAILLRRRSSRGILPGLWELPGGEKIPGESLAAKVRHHLQSLPAKLVTPKRIGEIRHTITNRKIRAPIFLFDQHAAARTGSPGPDWRWLSPSSLHCYPVSAMTLKAAKVLAAHDESSL